MVPNPMVALTQIFAFFEMQLGLTAAEFWRKSTTLRIIGPSYRGD